MIRIHRKDMSANEREEEEKDEEGLLFIANAVNEADSERDRAL